MIGRLMDNALAWLAILAGITPFLFWIMSRSEPADTEEIQWQEVDTCVPLSEIRYHERYLDPYHTESELVLQQLWACPYEEGPAYEWRDVETER